MAPDALTITVDGVTVRVPPGTTVAAALLHLGRTRFHDSPGGEGRGPVCGMGTCFECVVTVDGQFPVRSCLVRCRDGMEVVTRAAFS